MKLKQLVPLSLLFGSTLLIAEMQSIRIGAIDPQYKNSLTEAQLRIIIEDIQNVFEQQLGTPVISYSENGKPIDILYVPPSRAKKNIASYRRKVEQNRQKVQRAQQELSKLQDNLEYKRATLEETHTMLNKKVTALNTTVAQLKKQKLTETEAKTEQTKVDAQKENIDALFTAYKEEEKAYNTLVRKYNTKISQFNAKVRIYTRLSRKLETMVKSYREIKGAAIGYKEVKFKTFGDDRQNTKEQRVVMDKIEIYGFNSLNELRAVLAHELGHLVGVGHIDTDKALMNPVLQPNQTEQLRLTPKDIQAFERALRD